MVYSMNDLYPFSSQVEATTKQTIPESDEKNRYNENVVVDNDKKTVVEKGSIWTALIVLFGIMFLYGILKG